MGLSVLPKAIIITGEGDHTAFPGKRQRGTAAKTKAGTGPEMKVAFRVTNKDTGLAIKNSRPHTASTVRDESIVVPP
ncbi:hypothetical protein G5B47_03720 [Paenibacillus sp. 7124]|uniref:Uncharacterized protein n=1 Tax=Paenibacillus apii TaxID=1850370 RepID=A0A6M1PEC5_9BACL|nr:hypothetical protein [Paenibacillus apii]NGM81516.1 hypothetical protein [Paenibacillus apii]NJJ38101.1 hypothetical protein [Paenibacillus apii]